jgi:hypothetical protein
MNRKRIFILGSLLAMIAAVLSATLISPATETVEDVGFANFSAGWNVRSGGFGNMSSASFKVQSTLGQIAVAPSLSSASFKVCNGYQCGTGDDALPPTPTLTPTPTPTPTPLPPGVQAQTITFASVGNKKVGDVFNVSATASSGLPVTLSSLTPAVCTIAGNTVTAVAQGTCTIRASQAGNATFAPATADYNILISANLRFWMPFISYP